MEEDKKCVYCGERLPITSQLYKRKYCSIICDNKYKLRLKKPEVEEKLWVHEREIDRKAYAKKRAARIAREESERAEILAGTSFENISVAI